MMRVWAPLAGRVRLRAEGVDRELQRDGDHWSTPTTLAAGTEYSFLLDDGDPLPDPRSRRQPQGVHGPSAAFDPHEFAWTDTGWSGRQLAGGVIYELHIDTFTPEGTLDSAIGNLDHLVHLGVDFVELLPVNSFNGTHNWGYDGVLWYSVQESYGGPAAYQRFVDACHARGLAVIQDVVYNHLGPSGNYLPQFGPYLSSGRGTTWGEAVNLAHPEVRRYILDNATMWMRDYHVDGLRLDAVHALVDDPESHLLAELAEETEALSAFLRRPLSLIAESDLNDPRLIMPREAGGYGLAAQWCDDYHHAVHVALTGETCGYYGDFASLAALAKAATGGYFHDGVYSSFRGRVHGHPIDQRVPTWRLVGFAQNHDQIGNRAAGDRLSGLVDARSLEIAAVLTLAGPFTPLLFMGEEWGASTPWQFFTSHPEPELGRATAEGRIAEFARMGWDASRVPDPQHPDTFLRSKLDWSELDTPAHARVLELYRRLIALRREIPELTDPRFDQLLARFDDDACWFRLDRGSVSILVNFSAGEREIAGVRSRELLFATDAATSLSGVSATLPARSAAIVRG